MVRTRALTVVGLAAIAMAFLAGPMLEATTMNAAASSGPNLVSTAAAFSASSRLVFQNPRGLHRYYAMYYYGGDFTWWYEYSSDGISWSIPQSSTDGGLGSGSWWINDTGSLLVVHFVATDLIGSKLLYLRGTIADTAQAITWSAGQIVDPGGNNARNFGLSVTRTASGRPVITAVKEVFVNPTYRYEVRGWGADADSSAPVWKSTTLIPSVNSLAQQNAGFTSAYATTGDYVSVAGSAARGINPSSPWDVTWTRASWNGITWSTGPVTVLRSGEAQARPPSLVLDEAARPQALVAYPGPTPQLIHYRGTVPDGTTYQTYVLSTQVVTSSTLSVDRSVNPASLKAIYHYGTTNIYWKSSSSFATFSWGPENTISWSQTATDLSSSQRECLGRVHGLVESSNGVYYFNI